jgi:glycosyltransferase involved in cell wall biosynthesis
MSPRCCSCLQSSVTEGLPVSILEAGLSGVCVVCTDVGGCSELLRNGTRSFGRLTSAKNVQMIAYGQLEVMAMLPSLEILKLQQPPELDRDHLQALLHDPQVQQRRQEWGQEYREFILSRFSISVHAMQQRQALYLSQRRRNERKNELMQRNTTSVLC